MTPAATRKDLLNQIRLLLLALLVIAVGAAAHFAREFVVPVLFALFIAVMFRPPLRRLAAHGVPAWLGASLCMAGLLAVATVLLLLVVAPLGSALGNAPAYLQVLSRRIMQIRMQFEDLWRVTEKIAEAAQPGGSSSTAQVVVKDYSAFDYLAPAAGYSVSLIAGIVAALVIAGFLMASGDLFYEKLVRITPRMSDKKRAVRIVHEVETEVSAYLLLVTAVNAGFGLTVGLAFFALGMPAPHVWAALAFTFNFVPYLGAAAGITLSLLQAILVFDSALYALLAPAIYAAANGIENQFVSPYLVGRRFELNAVAILLALAFWTWLWGIGGTVLAVPMLVSIRILANHIESWSALGEFLSAAHPAAGSETAEPPSARQMRPISSSTSTMTTIKPRPPEG